MSAWTYAGERSEESVVQTNGHVARTGKSIARSVALILALLPLVGILLQFFYF